MGDRGKGRHHRGTHGHRSQLVRDAANRDPLTVCWSCGRTLAEHPPHRNGTPARWDAGHTMSGTVGAQPWLNTRELPPPGAWLAPQASTCNRSSGAAEGNRRRGTGYRWP